MKGDGRQPGRGALPRSFRKLSISDRRKALRALGLLDGPAWSATGGEGGTLELADTMVESSVGWLPVPLGIVTGMKVDGEELTVPLAVEEPSVIAGATFVGSVLSQAGGLATWAAPSLMSAQVFLEAVPPSGERAVLSHREDVEEQLRRSLASLAARGGGYRRMEVLRLAESSLLRVEFTVDVRDAMGANLLNTAAEELTPLLESLSGGRKLMAILSNAASERRAGARFALPVARLGALGGAGLSAAETARRLVLACAAAREDQGRALTHNKGIMNGIASLALATGNDTRAIEAAAHGWAHRTGRCLPLSEFALEDDSLQGSLELPLPFAAVGGAVGFHPVTRFCLELLGNPDGPRLARIAAAVGLVQNLAAVLALVTEGIQKGHMKLHASRLAYQAGARGAEIRAVAERLSLSGSFRSEDAAAALKRLRSGKRKT